MAALMKYEEKDVPQFQEEVCKKDCILKGKCIGEEGKDVHWFLMCPHYHKWKIGYGDTFVEEQLKWEREHPEEVEEKEKKNKEVAKKMREQKKLKKNEV